MGVSNFSSRNGFPHSQGLGLFTGFPVAAQYVGVGKWFTSMLEHVARVHVAAKRVAVKTSGITCLVLQSDSSPTQHFCGQLVFAYRSPVWGGTFPGTVNMIFLY